MFGRATIRLGIGPHSSLCCNEQQLSFGWTEPSNRRNDHGKLNGKLNLFTPVCCHDNDRCGTNYIVIATCYRVLFPMRCSGDWLCRNGSQCAHRVGIYTYSWWRPNSTRCTCSLCTRMLLTFSPVSLWPWHTNGRHARVVGSVWVCRACTFAYLAQLV